MRIKEYTDDDRQAYLVILIVGYYHSLYKGFLFHPGFTGCPKPHEICYMAYDDELPIGLIKFKESGNLVDISHFVVLPDHRRKGVAKLLIAQVEKRAREKGIPTIEATITYGAFEGDPRLQELLNIYDHLGFRLDGIGAWISSCNIPEGFVNVRDQRDKMIYVSQRDLKELKDVGIIQKYGKDRNYDLIKRVQ